MTSCSRSPTGRSPSLRPMRRLPGRRPRRRGQRPCRSATTSLPERLEGVRNYDYRYAWIRDQCYAGMAMAAHGAGSQLSGTIGFITGRLLADGPDLKPAYTVSGDRIPGESGLRLRGYPGGSARAGNRVNAQFQLDSLGEALQLLAAAAELDLLGPDDMRAAEMAAAAIERRWTEPESGIWELHDDYWTHSWLACVAGLRAMAGATAAQRMARGSLRAGAGWRMRSWRTWIARW